VGELPHRDRGADRRRERVVVLVRDYGKREADAPEVELRGAAIWTVRGGRIVRAESHADRAEALASVGLAE
jgi:ketosteroid isomerase-like protein